MKIATKLFAILAIVVTMMTGCAVNRATAVVDPTANLGSIKTMHVTTEQGDDRAINVLIADKLRSRGYVVTTDPEEPSGVDAVITYVDKWMWDITMYMLELTVTVRDPKNGYPLASGNSFHTSLTRKSPIEMVSEVIDNIFKEQKK